ncbi:uncharacterized protein LOC131148715 [Malania oleifera]|uniref:uncharacterized protein LOC131148715 n=1 Tax=Malania oleifera TaxID=397392 RepID=UPI0025AE293B|nr:uncharacterized protein LOC131148715 [Malania oleifera]
MPQVDLDTLVSVCGGGSCDRKIACETLADSHHQPEDVDRPENNSDLPPDSFWLSKDAELDWFDRNAYYERKDSAKGNSNSTNLNPNTNPNSNSQRFSATLKSKASILGLPKPQKACFAESKMRHKCKPPNLRLFPKRPQPEGKSAVPVAEPSSPKVSCMGRVRSKKDKGRRRPANRQRQSGPAEDKEKAVVKRRTGLFTSLRGIFRSGCRHKPAVQVDDRPKESPIAIVSSPSPLKSVPAKASDFFATETPAEPPGLGGVKKFASGRKSESWVELDETVAKSESSDGDSVRERRGVGPLKGVECHRQWACAGPASV